jgi:ClpP class serine protease
MADPRITDVVLQFHSPGGEVYGVKEMADHIYSQRGVKNIVAVADTLMCSAAYYLGAAAERVYVSPTAKTGSVGVVQVAVDESQALAESGIKVEINRIPEGKFRGSGLEPITDDDRRHSAESIGRIYDQFTADVSRYRGVPQSVVKASFGNGRDVDAGYAVDNSMADRIGSMSDVLAKALSGTLSRSLSQTSTRAEEPTVDIRRKKLALMSTAR